MKLQSLILYFEKIEMYLGINIPVLQDFLSFILGKLYFFILCHLASISWRILSLKKCISIR